MPIHVLLIEDNLGDARLIVEMLKESGDKAFSVECAESLSIGIDKLSKQLSDAVLLDLSLPDSHGLDTFFRLQSEFPHLPTVILTGLDDEEAAVQAARAGAQDYLLKGTISGISLGRALKYAMERKKAEERYRTLFDSMDEGFCTIEVIFNESNKPVDCRYLEANRAFQKQVGISNLVGRTISEIIPPKEAYRFEIYGDVALTGEPARFESEIADLHRWFDVHAFHTGEPQERKVAILLNNITERKKAEAALQESETRFRTLAAFVPQFVWVCTPDGLNVYFNQRWVDYTGLTLEESYGRGWNTPFHVDDKRAAWDAWNHAVATGEPYQVDSRLRAADGTYRWFLIRGTPMRDPAGKIVSWFGACTDIQDLKRIEAELSQLNQELDKRVRQRTAELEAADARLGRAQRAAMAGIWNWDLLTGKVTWSPELLDLFGLQATEHASLKTWERIMHPEDRKRAAANVERAIKDRIPLENEYRIVLPGGQERWIRAVGNTIYDENGVPQSMAGICLDVTDRKAAEAKLRETTHRFQTIVDNAPIAIYVKNRDGRFVFGNRQLERYTGLPLERLLGMTDYDFASKEDGDRWREIDLTVLAGQRAEVEETGTDNAGKRYVNISVKFPLIDESGRPVEVCGISTDITAIKRAEQELRERTVQLEAANKELESFNYAVAHDLRGALRHIHGFTEILAEEVGPSLDESSRRHLQTIQDSVQQMAHLLEDLLNLARLGRQELRRQTCGLNAMVKEVVATLQPEVKDRKVEWRIAELPVIDCDPTLMKQVLVNLLSNALKFTGLRQTAVIEIGQTKVDGESVIFVRDNGVGFNMKFADKLFGLFQRLHRREEFEGTGVGLAIVQRIIQRHGGRVWAKAELNKGATFYIDLHSCESENDKQEVIAHAAISGSVQTGEPYGHEAVSGHSDR